MADHFLYVCVSPSRPSFCNTGHQWQVCQRSDGSRSVVTKPQHNQETCRPHRTSCCRTLQVMRINSSAIILCLPLSLALKSQTIYSTHTLTYIILCVLQRCTALHFRWGVCGRCYGLWWCGSSVPDEASGSGSNIHQAALLDAHTIQQVCVHGRRHTGEKRTMKNHSIVEKLWICFLSDFLCFSSYFNFFLFLSFNNKKVYVSHC